MVIQFKQNYMDGWQKARFLAESILSEGWLFLFKWGHYNINNYHESLALFHNRIKEMKNEVHIQDFLCISESPNADLDNPDWIKSNFADNINVKKDLYIKYRVDDQITWYTRKGSQNLRQGNLFFTLGLICMIIGIIFTIIVLQGSIPNLSYLSFFTTITVSLFSWKQTKRYEELKTTYSVAADELSDFKKALSRMQSEDDLKNTLDNIERAISREHKLWFSKRME
jgi:hypothetical protein